MRISDETKKIIKKRVKENVFAKNPEYNELNNEQHAKRMQFSKNMDLIRAAVEKAARDIIENYGYTVDEYQSVTSLHTYGIHDKPETSDRIDEIDNIINEIDNIINRKYDEIIMAIEFGGTKSNYMSIIEEVLNKE